MSVLFLAPLPNPITGQSIACQAFLEALAETHAVDVIDMAKSELTQGISSLTRLGEVAGFLCEIWRRRHGATAIYFTVSQSGAGNAKDLLIFLLCFKQLPRMVIHLHGGAGMREILRGGPGLRRRANEFFLRRLGAAVVLGDRHLDLYRGIVPEDRIHVVPNFAADSLFADEEAIDARFSAPGPLRVLFLSNLIPGKGHLDLLEAYLHLDRDLRNSIVLDFAGAFESPKHEASFLDRIRRHRQIRYHGTVAGDTKRRLFHEAHVFCLPTYYPYEGQPISILEAYASGCAVITTDHSGIRDVFSAPTNGYEVAKRSAPDLQVALRAAVGDRQTLHAMGRFNRRLADANYRTAHYNARLLAIVDNVMQGRQT